MKKLTGLLMLSLLLIGCSYNQDMNEIYNDNTKDAEDVLYNQSERIEEIEELNEYK